MARERFKQPQPPTGFIASAVRLGTSKRNEVGTTQSWQKTAWGYYDTVGELRYLSNWIGNIISRAELQVGHAEGEVIKPLAQGEAHDALQALYGGPQGQSQMLAALGTNLTVGGEAYLVHHNKSWHTLASGKVTKKRQGDEIQYDLGDGVVDKTRRDLVIRIWTPHPTSPKQADAPTRSNLTTLAQIVGYDSHISAQLQSRLSGAGLLLLPSEIDFAPDPEADAESTQADSIMIKFAEVAEAVKQDPGSPASQVPIILMAPGEAIANARHMTFWSELDKSVIDMRNAAIQRFGIGMDVPPEVLMGTGDSNHWNAWLSEESAIKAHLEPRLAVITQALTDQYLRPALKGVIPDDEIENYYVMADTSNIRNRPNHATEAFELHDRALIGREAVIRETGFKHEDAMDDKEYTKWLLQRIATGAVTPELTAEALRLLGAQIANDALEDNGTQEPPDHTRTDITPAPDPRALPSQDDALIAACEVLVYRALERAGNKLKNAANGKSQNMAADTMYLHFTGDPDLMLSGSWECAPKVLGEYSVNVDATVETLDFYVRGLLSQQRPHDRSTMKRLLSVGEPLG